MAEATPPAPVMPPAPVNQPASAPAPAPSTMPPGPVPAAAAPAQAPELHGWRKALDAIGSIFPAGRAVEQAIPGTPQNFDMKQALAAARGEKQAGIERTQQETAASKSQQGINEQESKLVPVPDHPEMGLVEQKNLAAIQKQLAANQGRSDVAQTNQEGATQREQMRIDSRPAIAAGIKMGALKPDIVAQVGPMPDDPAAQAEWGRKYDELAAKKGGQTGLGAYAMVRLLDWATKYQPQLLPMLPQILKGAGLNVPPGVDVSGIPAGMPRDNSGNPIGTAMPEAPTQQTRSRGQFAESGVTDQLPRINKEIDALGDELGPVAGRYNEFMAGTVGADNPKFTKLRTGLQNIATAWMRLHANSDGARQEFEAALARAKTPANLKAALESIGEQAADYVKRGKGNQPSGGEGGPPKPEPGMKVQSRTVNGKTEYRQVPINGR